MIVQNKQQEAQGAPDEHDPLLGSSSSNGVVPPPPFEDVEHASGSHQLVDFSQNNQLVVASAEAPPDFALYEADYFETGSGNLVSHDPHLNTDGEALYRFLLAQADKTPSYRLHCKGTHDEHRTRWVTEHHSSDGRHDTRLESYSETVTDFDFYIDIGPGFATKPIHWSVADDEPAYRGLMVREVESVGHKRVVKRAERKAYAKWSEEREAMGYPPWVVGLDGWTEETAEANVVALRSSKSLRQWADEYCASPKLLKEFVYHKVLYGWNIQQLKAAIRSCIKSTMYQGSVTVELKETGSKIYIRPDNKLSRMLSNKWLKFLSIILFIFPFIWLFKRFHSRGGGRWEVCGGAYALKQWVPLAEQEEEILRASGSNSGDLPPGYTSTSFSSAPRVKQTRTGTFKLLGLREGEWFRKWEGTITRAVISKYQASAPILDTRNNADLVFLDGY
ncbi:hypothetical protein Hypma_015550 [Hypsizygus marmoreus]|uniref:Uncharacterized protein n=1 Tax=Hypsizygus marmoreus TaxID=39966 RepID=A0A369K4Q1_HYPMA|nr:hypothetical protein Hypma_015550 [Hypsizygus marmoreus]